MNDVAYEKLPYRKGVGAVLVNAEGLVFVARRIDTPEDAWQLPQGGIDKGEKPRKAVLRELREEIGTDKAEIVARTRDWLRYDLPPEIAARVWKGRFRGQEQRWFLLRFTGTDGDIVLDTGHPEFCDWKWARLTDLPGMIIPFKRALYERIVTEFAPLVDGARPGGNNTGEGAPGTDPDDGEETTR